MNQSTKKEVSELLDKLKTIEASVRNLSDELNEKYDNLSERQQDSDRGMAMWDEAECLTNAADSIDDAINELTDCMKLQQ